MKKRIIAMLLLVVMIVSACLTLTSCGGKEDDGKLVWECPNCGNRDQNKMNVARRTCGYIGSQYWNQGRTQEIQERVLHL